MADLKDLKALIIDEIPLSTIVGQYIPIKVQGTAKKAVCPFHDDHDPSMSVSDEKKIFKCFACGEYGNAIDFVVKYKNLDFIEGLKEICERNGIDFERYFQKKKQDPKFEMAKKILSRVSTLYRKTASSKKYPAYNDFIEKRGLSELIAQTYHLGYAPKDNRVTHYLQSIPSRPDREFALKVAEELALIHRNTPEKEAQLGRSHYDTFRERIIFPIWDHYGQVIGYTSRATESYQKAKYKNSRDSFIFNKSKILYGFHLAKKSIRENDAVIVVEGNMDQIALHSKGFENSVAIMGTAFGEFHLNILKSMTKNIYLAFDNDKAGWDGANRANLICLNQGIIPRYISFQVINEDGNEDTNIKDADDFLKSQGRLELQKRIEEAKTFIDIKLEKLIPTKVPEVLDQKIALLKQAFEVLAPLKLELEATERILSFAQKIGLQSDRDTVLKQYTDFIESFRAPFGQVSSASPTEAESAGHASQVQELENTSTEPSEEQLREIFSSPEPLTSAEKILIRQVVQHPEILTHSKSADLLDFVRSDDVKEYVWRLSDLVYEVDENEYPQVVRALSRQQNVSKEIKTVIDQGLVSHRPNILNEKVLERLIGDMRLKLEVDKLNVEREELLAQREMCHTQEDLNQLLSKLSELDKKLSNIKSNKSVTTDLKSTRPTQGSR